MTNHQISTDFTNICKIVTHLCELIKLVTNFNKQYATAVQSNPFPRLSVTVTAAATAATTGATAMTGATATTGAMIQVARGGENGKMFRNKNLGLVRWKLEEIGRTWKLYRIFEVQEQYVFCSKVWKKMGNAELPVGNWFQVLAKSQFLRCSSFGFRSFLPQPDFSPEFLLTPGPSLECSQNTWHSMAHICKFMRNLFYSVTNYQWELRIITKCQELQSCFDPNDQVLKCESPLIWNAQSGENHDPTANCMKLKGFLAGFSKAHGSQCENWTSNQLCFCQRNKEEIQLDGLMAEKTPKKHLKRPCCPTNWLMVRLQHVAAQAAGRSGTTTAGTRPGGTRAATSGTGRSGALTLEETLGWTSRGDKNVTFLVRKKWELFWNGSFVGESLGYEVRG